jgi:hypothetical protein
VRRSIPSASPAEVSPGPREVQRRQPHRLSPSQLHLWHAPLESRCAAPAVASGPWPAIGAVGIDETSDIWEGVYASDSLFDIRAERMLLAAAAVR